MNVTFVALGVYGHEGGIERFNRRLLSSLASSGHRLNAVLLWDTAPEAAAGLPQGVTVAACGRSKARAVGAFVRGVLRRRPDVIVYGHVLLTPLSLLTRVLRRRAVNVLVVHGYEVWDRPSAPRRRLVRMAIDRIASVSDYTARRMADAYGIDPARFVRIVNAVDAGEAPPPAARTGDKLLVVSRLDPRNKAKNVDKVIAAMPRVLTEAPGTQLYVVGDGGWRGELEALARRLAVDDHVRFLGSVPDDRREALYATSDVFVLPSTQEGFGIVYLEAWRHSLPVIAGSGGAAPEVVRDGVEGVVVEPAPDAIAGAILHLLRDPELRRGMGAAGYRRLTAHYTGRHFDEAVSKMLDDAVAAS